MENKTINKQIRAVSNRSSLLIIIFLAITIPVRFLFRYLGQNGSDDSLWRNSAFVTFLSYLGLCLVVYPIILLVYYKLLNMFHNHPIASVCLSLLQLLLCFFYIAAPIMLIVEIIKKRNDFGLNKGDYPCSTAKKALIYLTAPLTIIMYAAVFVMIVILMTE